jgi:hypothetical protein
MEGIDNFVGSLSLRDRMDSEAVLLGLEGNLPRSSRLLTRTGIRRWLLGNGQSDAAANNCMFFPSHPRFVFNYHAV